MKIELVTASEWKRAAIVWAFTEDMRGKNPTSGILNCQQFADLSISGLSSKNTVTKYRKAWKLAIEHGFATDVKPGDLIDLPDLDWQTYFNPPLPKLDKAKRQIAKRDRGKPANTRNHRQRRSKPHRMSSPHNGPVGMRGEG